MRVLILEDDLETLSRLTESLVGLQKRFKDLDLANISIRLIKIYLTSSYWTALIKHVVHSIA